MNFVEKVAFVDFVEKAAFDFVDFAGRVAFIDFAGRIAFFVDIPGLNFVEKAAEAYLTGKIVDGASFAENFVVDLAYFAVNFIDSSAEA